MTDDELLHQVQRDQIREILREVLSERDRRAEEERQAQAKAEQEELERIGRIGRINLDPKTKSALIERLGAERYAQLPLYGEDQPRDRFGRYR